MKDKDILILNKILKYIEEIKLFIEGYNEETFDSDRKTINACVFNLSQIGELAGKISEDTINENPRNRVERTKSIKKQNCA